MPKYMSGSPETGGLWFVEGQPEAQWFSIGGVIIDVLAAQVLRHALCPPDPAQEAREKLEMARVDGVISWHVEDSPTPERSEWAVHITGEHGYTSVVADTDLAALQQAAAYVETLRVPATPEPVPVEELSATDCISELRERGWNEVDDLTHEGFLRCLLRRARAEAAQ